MSNAAQWVAWFVVISLPLTTAAALIAVRIMN
jgi:hypothetical protein